ncbi:peptidoglycan-binding protein [Streptomyces sp. TRM66268-LWL]|uniref:Peptidoglycan-binding protein n=2 Tax=Streptomyces polyasparticus TaxID=2767826 RepID=A0ABR7SVC3_9ACTN|nr:peptidoglycan-binding protein [Streptomyces polyasparticus]
MTAVTRGDLEATKSVPGELGYAEGATVQGTAPGTVTWLPGIGATVKRGEALYKVDNRPVVLLYGNVPMYRDLTKGLKGPDVRQVNDNLRTLGYGAPAGDTFTSATAASVRAWQRDLSAEGTGQLAKGGVVFTPGSSARSGALGRGHRSGPRQDPHPYRQQEVRNRPAPGRKPGTGEEGCAGHPARRAQCDRENHRDADRHAGHRRRGAERRPAG